MKKIILIITTFLAFAPMNISCQNFELNEKMVDATFTLDEKQTLIEDAPEQRVQITLTVKGINEEEYTIDYKIDGKPGIEKNSLTIYNTAFNDTGLYSFGEIHMDKGMYTDDYNGNFPSGSSTKLHYLNDGKYKHPSLGTANFLTPKLNPGTHTIEYTITNSLGETVNGNTTFTF